MTDKNRQKYKYGQEVKDGDIVFAEGRDGVLFVFLPRDIVELPGYQKEELCIIYVVRVGLSDWAGQEVVDALGALSLLDRLGSFDEERRKGRPFSRILGKVFLRARYFGHGEQ